VLTCADDVLPTLAGEPYTPLVRYLQGGPLACF
jgi:exodeoxyribonuclease V gamma subunit